MCTTSVQRLQRWSNIVQMGERGNSRLPAQRGHTRKSIKYTLIGSSQHQGEPGMGGGGGHTFQYSCPVWNPYSKVISIN